MRKYTYLCVFEAFKKNGSPVGTGNAVIKTDKRVKTNSMVREVEDKIGKELGAKYITLTNIVLLDEEEVE